MKKVLIILAIMISFNVGMLWKSVTGYIETIEYELEQATRETVIVELPVEVEIEVPRDVNHYISVQKNLIELDLPDNITGEFKTYMDYRTITSKSSKQWALQQLCYTNEDGFRMFNGQYTVAVGTFYADSVGKELMVTFDTEISIHAVVGDIKMDIHTDVNNQYIPFNGNIVEFIIDKEVIDSQSLKLGNVSGVGLEGKIVSIREVSYE